MDRTDCEILFLLQQNARISMSEISTHVNLSVSAVSERLKKLEQSGLILRYTAILDPVSFNKTLNVFVGVEVTNNAHLDALEAYIAKEPDILEYHRFAGGSDLLLKIVTDDTETLDRILTILKTYEGVGRLRVNLITASPKCETSVKPIM